MSRSKNLWAIALAAVAFALAAACQKADNQNTAAAKPDNKAAVNVSQSNAATTNGGTSAGSLASPSEAYKTAYDARKNKDIPALKRVMSRDLIDYLTRMGESNENKRQTLDEVLQDLSDRPQAPNGEIRDEKIDGDRAIVEYKDETGKWRPMDFVKENGEWKLTLPKRGMEPVRLPDR